MSESSEQRPADSPSTAVESKIAIIAGVAVFAGLAIYWFGGLLLSLVMWLVVITAFVAAAVFLLQLISRTPIGHHPWLVPLTATKVSAITGVCFFLSMILLSLLWKSAARRKANSR